ncbi:MAG: GldG family protein [Thermoguttaceae bacterium]|nr:GldG family protein [Thermoguttaceae bacterium]MDW8079067.1 hypothetical protein [Thermoguttaceae bacterium]
MPAEGPPAPKGWAVGLRTLVKGLSGQGTGGPSQSTAHLDDGARLRPLVLTGVVLLLLSAWWQAGALGLMAGPLRRAGANVLGIVAIAGLAAARGGVRAVLLGGLAILLLVGLWNLAGELTSYWVPAAVASLLAAAWSARSEKELLSALAVALGVAGLFHLAILQSGPVAHAIRWLSAGWGSLAAGIVGQHLRVGPSFAVPEIVLVVGLLGLLWLFRRGFRGWQLVGWASLVVAIHTLYLGIQSLAPQLLASLPPPPPIPPLESYTPPPWNWASELRNLIPWNMPVLAAGLQLGCLALTLGLAGRGRPAQPAGAASALQCSSDQASEEAVGPLVQLARVIAGRGTIRLRGTTFLVLMAELAVVFLFASLFHPPMTSPEGLTVLAWKGGFLHTEVPGASEELDLGSWGGLGMLLAGWGAKLQLSEELLQEELRAADVVLIVHPDRPWPQERVNRLHEYLENGGKLLFVGGYHFRDGDRASQFGQILERIGVRLPFQTIVSPGRSGADGTVLAFHRAVFTQNLIVGRMASAAGAPVEAPWPARPLVWTRWAWADSGSDVMLTGVSRWEEGEPLGDLIVAAEVAVAKGRVVVWGHPEIITDHNLLRHYPLLGRLLVYLAGSPSPWQEYVYDILFTLGIGIIAIGLATLRPQFLAELTLVVSLALTALFYINGAIQPDFIPDGRRHPQWNNVVAIDLGHHNHGSLEPWAPDGLGAFSLQLLRCGYLPVGIETIRGDILQRAGILVSIAPQRSFSPREQKVVEDFVNSGGVFIALVGADRSAGSRSFLRRLGLDPGCYPVPAGSSEPEPEPMGCIHTFYRAGNVEYDSAVLFYAAWPVGCLPTEHLIRGKDNLPVAAIRPQGRGVVVLIGDSDFALNTNLEFIRQPVDGRELNRAFWRWFLSWVTPQPDWLPPPAPERAAEAAAPQEVRIPKNLEKSPPK